MIELSGRYGELRQIDAKYKVKPREDLFKLLDTRPSSILELGCADGTNLVFFRNRLRALGVNVDRLVGVDSHAIANCSQYAEFEFVHSTVEHFIDGHRDAFDLIILSDIVEHLYNPWHVLTSLGRNLAAGGRLLISVPNLQNIRYIVGVVSGKFYYEQSGLMDVTHIRFFSMETLASLLDSSGYAVSGTGYRPDLSLSSDVLEWRRRVKNGGETALSFGACNIAVTAENIDLLSAQQLLVCARKKNPERTAASSSSGRKETADRNAP